METRSSRYIWIPPGRTDSQRCHRVEPSSVWRRNQRAPPRSAVRRPRTDQDVLLRTSTARMAVGSMGEMGCTSTVVDGSPPTMVESVSTATQRCSSTAHDRALRVRGVRYPSRSTRYPASVTPLPRLVYRLRVSSGGDTFRLLPRMWQFSGELIAGGTKCVHTWMISASPVCVVLDTGPSAGPYTIHTAQR
jgi:hypothetical protein